MDSKLRDLLQVAVSKTESGELDWQAFDAESFRAKIGSGFLHLQRGSTEIVDGDGLETSAVTYSVQVSDAQGRVVAEDYAVAGVLANEFSLLNRLFVAARKSALKTDHVIDDMLRTLQSSK